MTSRRNFDFPPLEESGSGRFLGEGQERVSEEFLDADDLGMEIMGIFSQSPRAPAPSHAALVSPPSRNSNPLVKDSKFSTGREGGSDRDALSSSLAHCLSNQRLDVLDVSAQQIARGRRTPSE